MTIIGHDDLFLPHYLQTIHELINEHPNASLYQTHYDFIDAKGEFIRHCLPMAPVQKADEFLACHILQTMDSMGTGYMMRSKEYDAIGGMPHNYPNLLFADYELWIRLIAMQYKATTTQSCFLYRLHNSMSRVTNGEDYAKAFGEYIHFLVNFKMQYPAIEKVTQQHGKQLLMYYCESLSHRILKTPADQRKIKVSGFILCCEQYADLLIPGQGFYPLKAPRIWAAKILDSNRTGRSIFALAKKLKLV
jgi:hypothetical protein